MIDLSVCTIVAKNYLAFARVLGHSLRAHNPGVKLYVLLVDELDGSFDPAAEPFELIPIRELAPLIPNLTPYCFKYTVLELSTAAKSSFIRYLFERRQVGKILYLDPDILVLDSLQDLSLLLDRHSVLVTPHLTAPLADDLQPGEFDIMRAGIYNLGFIGLRNDDSGRALLRWWQERCYDRCVVSPDEGLFVDQRWIDLVPGYFPDVHVLRSPSCNVAYWNLHHRNVEEKDGHWQANGARVAFFHFSGFDPENPRKMSMHQTRHDLAKLPRLMPLFERYARLLFDAGHAATRRLPYAFACFSNKMRIPDVVRRVYLSMEATGASARFGDPFCADGPASFFSWLQAPASRRSTPPFISNLLLALHQRTPILRGMFPDPAGANLNDYGYWFRVHGRVDFALEPDWLSGLGSAPLPREGLTRRMVRMLRRTSLFQMNKHLMRRMLGASRWDRLRGRFLPPTLSLMPEEVRAAKPSVPLNTPGVNLAGYFASETGVGQGVRGMASALNAAGVAHVSNFFVTNDPSRQNDASVRDFAPENPFPVNLIHVNADQVPVFARTVGDAYFANRYNIGFWNWELDRLPEEWHDRFGYFDEVWAPSRFCLEAYAAASPVPVVRVPLAVDVPAVSRSRSKFGLDERAFIFLLSFDFRSVFERKNPLATIEAFKNAFRGDDRAQLVVKSTNEDADPTNWRRVQQTAGSAGIRLLPGYLGRDEVYELMASADAYVSLHRSEGFGLTMAEAMALGVPVIASAYSANLDFMTLANSYLVRCERVELERDFGPYKKGNRWANPDVEHAASHMREVYGDPDSARARGRLGQRDVRSSLAPAAVGQIVNERLAAVSRARHASSRVAEIRREGTSMRGEPG